ncbi:CoA ester lyase [Candidatus Falkowbacteria bacterium]|nr:CoA ester lyase [Candidatus Falkowbacteria bacterium]
MPVCNINSECATITVRADAPYDTLEEMIAYAKANPGSISFGNSGVGGIWHFIAAAVASSTGMEVTHVPFEGGGTAVTALAGGHVDAVPVTPQEVEVQVKAGRAKVLAVLAPERVASLPNVPTAKELGSRFRPDRLAMQAGLGLCLLAARAHGLTIVDGVFNAFKDDAGLKVECDQGRDMGFDGKTLIHPAQLDIANAAFAPSEAEIDLARRQIAAFDAAQAEGLGVAVVDGKIVENLHIVTARQTLAKAEAIAAMTAI